MNLFKELDSDSVIIGTLSVKILYNLFLDDDYVPKIVQKNPDIEFQFVFKHVFNKFIDKYSRDVIYKIVHEILPVNNLMYTYNIYKSNLCMFCRKFPETLRHLFFECGRVSMLLVLIKNWIFALSKGTVDLDFEHLQLRNINVSDKKIFSVMLLIVGLYCKTVWLNRNSVKFDYKNVTDNMVYLNFLSQLKLRILADYERLPERKFRQYWCISDLFCKLQNEILNITFF